MIKLIYFMCLMSVSLAQAVHYDNYDINDTLNQPHLNQITSDYIQQYFSSPKPNAVIQDLLKINMTPLEREYILHQMLTEISQRPPQDFFQGFVDRMKTYEVQATRKIRDGHLPQQIFNLNSKAHGIENIWTAYRTEQQFHQLFKNDLPKAVNNIQQILAQDTVQRRPQWLGVKNSLSAMSEDVLTQLSEYLIAAVKPNVGLDTLISHVGLMTGNIELINKALLSEQKQVRQKTLRQLTSQLTPAMAKTILMNSARTGTDRQFSTSLLSQYSNDKTVEKFLITQLGDQQNASSAAFALSQSTSTSLPQALKNQFLTSTDSTTLNHVLMALKLNASVDAQLALDDLRKNATKNPTAKKWLQSFDTPNKGAQQ